MNSKKTFKSILSIIMCMFLFSACGSDSVKKEAVSVATNVDVYKVSKSEISSTVSYAGTITACDSVSISSKVGAKALSVNTSEGSLVSAGETLLLLDKSDMENAYKQAKAAYDSAVASYNSVANASTVQATSQTNQALVAAQTAYDQAKANYDREKNLYDNASNVKLATQNHDDAKSAYDRTKQLFDMGGASQVELDAAYSRLLSAQENLKTVKTTESAALDAAKSALTNAENALNTAKQNIKLTATANSAAIQSATAGVASAKTAMEIAASNLSNTTITAPISGYVTKCNVSAGQLVSPGIELFNITNTNMVNAEINVTESVIPYLKIGGKVKTSVTSANINNLEGAISAINPVKDPMTGLYNVKIAIDNKDDAIKVGMLCDVELTLSELTDIIKIPSKALINSNNEYFVYVANGDKAQKVVVTLGISDEEFTEIMSGLSEGDEVVVSGKEYLSEKNNDIKVVSKY